MYVSLQKLVLGGLHRTTQFAKNFASRAGNIQANSRVFRVSDEVREAVRTGKPVVALESTIYTHGLPYPDNLKLAFELESIVREHGAVPATCAVLEGQGRVGLEKKELQALVEASDVLKVSRRDLGFLIGLGSKRGTHGGTTISGTMILAHLAGIKVFATGGLGGVHRGGESSLDISADLTELGRTPVAVISSGPKGFLDIPRTLEYLETQGALVATFADGREGMVDFPAFWARDSGVRSPAVLLDEAEAAAIIHAQHALPLSSGMLFANPVPSEFSIPVTEMTDIIQQALDSAIRAGATGNANTPFVLNAIRELSGGRSVVANRALVYSNVRRGARVAVELSRLENRPFQNLLDGNNGPDSAINHVATANAPGAPMTTSASQASRVDLLVAGSLAVDISCNYKPSNILSNRLSPELHTSNPCEISDGLGGVAHNIAKAAHLMGTSVRLCSAVADDLAGRGALDALGSGGLDISAIKVLQATSGAKTARYVSVNDAGKNLVMACSDMSIIECQVKEFDALWEPQIAASKPQWLVVDANWNASVLHRWLSGAKKAGIQTAFEPVSNAKSRRIFEHQGLEKPLVYPESYVDLASPNSFELQAMYEAARHCGLFERQDWWQVVDSFGIPSTGARTRMASMTSPALVDKGIPQQSIQLLPFIPALLTKLGPEGVLFTRILPVGDERLSSPAAAPYILSRSGTDAQGVGGIYMRLFPTAEIVPEADILSVNGVGDTFLGALMAGLTQLKGSRIEDVIGIAQQASIFTLKSENAVSPNLVSLRPALRSTSFRS